MGGDANLPGEGSNRTALEIDTWTNYNACRWINNPEPSTPVARSLPISPDLIPDSEPNNAATASFEEIESGEEDLASVPSTVQVGSPRSTDGKDDPSARSTRSPGGTWRNTYGS